MQTTEDTTKTLESGILRQALSSDWLEVQETGGPLVITVNGTPDFVIFPMGTEVRMSNEQAVVDMAARMYAYASGKQAPDPRHEKDAPRIGPDALRRSLGEERRKMRTFNMRPHLYTLYGQVVGVLFPIPFKGGNDFLEQLTRLWYPERYEWEGDNGQG